MRKLPELEQVIAPQAEARPEAKVRIPWEKIDEWLAGVCLEEEGQPKCRKRIRVLDPGDRRN